MITIKTMIMMISTDGHPWSFPLSANRADLLGEHFLVDKFRSNCSSKVDEKYTLAREQALGARMSEREIGRH